MTKLLVLSALIAASAAAPLCEEDRQIAANQTLRGKRGAPITAPWVLLWNPNTPIPYTFKPDFPQKARKTAREAMDSISAATCLTFNENPSASSKIQFNTSPSRCSSALGSPGAGSTRDIFLAEGCQTTTSTAHEVLHALGIHHTMTRFDRDNYVTVNMNSINPNFQHNFEKMEKSENNNFGVPFDYGSILAYPAYAFSKNGSQTIVPKDAQYTSTLGRRHYIQFTDLQLINKLYNCSSKCSGSSLQCQNGGFVNPRDCRSCFCTQYFTGTRCEKAKDEIVLTAQKPSHTVKFENAYNASIEWWKSEDWKQYGTDGPKIFRAPSGKRLQLEIKKIFWGVPYACVSPCSAMGIEINEGNDLTVSGKLFCCDKDEGKKIVSKTNVLGYKSYAAIGFSYRSEVTVSIVN